jgi:chaperone required for assembly of F1-ATPase
MTSVASSSRLLKCEQDWQAEQWGWDSQAEEGRKLRRGAFEQAERFAKLLRET